MNYNEKFIEAKEKLARKGELKHSQQNSRIPPGQTLTTRFPVLDLGAKPTFNQKTWRLHVYGLVEKEHSFTYDEILKMPATTLKTDLHCVTKWSKLDVEWKGILFKDFVKIVKPKPTWKFLIQEGLDGYTTNVSREDVEQENVLLAYGLEGKALPEEHGAPMRMIIPHLYAWKGSKFLTCLKFVEKDELGFWEVRGYHNHGDAFKEERYG